MTRTLQSTGFAALAFSIALGLVAATVSQPAAATELRITAQDDDVLTKRVSVADLDLSQAKDVRRLEGRIRSAARFVCAPLSAGRVLVEEANCRAVAQASTVTQVAALRERATRLAAAGMPSRIETTLAVVGTEAE